MSLSKIYSLLRGFPLKYKEQELKFKEAKPVELSYWGTVLEVRYSYTVNDIKKPFVIYEIFDKTFLRLTKFLKHLLPEEVKNNGGPNGRNQTKNQYDNICYVIDLEYNGEIREVRQYGGISSDFEIILGTENEEVFRNGKHDAFIKTYAGDLHYTITYSEGRNGMFSFVDDSSIYLRPKLHLSNVIFMDDYYLDGPELTDELKEKLKNAGELEILDLSPELVGLLNDGNPSHEIKMSELTKGFLELLLFYVIEEDSFDLSNVSPSHAVVSNTLYPLLEDIDDSYVMPSLDSLFIDGKEVQPLKSHWSDTRRMAEETFVISYTIDALRERGMLD